jgi:hypothetical protein
MAELSSSVLQATRSSRSRQRATVHYANCAFQLEELQRLNLDVFVHVPRN